MSFNFWLSTRLVVLLFFRLGHTLSALLADVVLSSAHRLVEAELGHLDIFLTDWALLSFRRWLFCFDHLDLFVQLAVCFSG